MTGRNPVLWGEGEWELKGERGRKDGGKGKGRRKKQKQAGTE